MLSHLLTPCEGSEVGLHDGLQSVAGSTTIPAGIRMISNEKTESYYLLSLPCFPPPISLIQEKERTSYLVTLTDHKQTKAEQHL